MPPPLAQVLLVAFALVWFAAFAVAVVQSRRRRREHGEPREPPLIDPELTRFGTPFSPIRAEAARLVREGLAADDPATAYVTRRLAERELPLRENPWVARGYALIALSQVPIITFQGLDSGADAPFFLGFLLVVMAVTVAAGVLTERYTRRRRANAEHAMELNESLAAEFEGTERAWKKERSG